MSLHARLLLSVCLSLAVTIGCGGEPPEKEMQQAQAALEAARAAGAETYAADEYAAAQQALANARDAVTQRDYRLALDRALDSRERAQNAATQAADSKAAARVDADRELMAAQAALNAAAAKLKEAETARLPGRQLEAPRHAIDTARTALQEARATFDKGNYQQAADRAKAATASLPAALEALDAGRSTAPRRHS